MKIGHCQTPTWDPYSWYMALKSPPINWHDWKHSDFNLLWRKNAEICNNTRFCYHLLVLNGCMVDRYIATNNCRNPHEYHKVYQFVDCLSLKHDWYMVYGICHMKHIAFRLKRGDLFCMYIMSRILLFQFIGIWNLFAWNINYVTIKRAY